jgi:hypothetical protein
MKTVQTHVTCAVASASGFAVPYSTSATPRDPKGYMEKHPEFEVVRTSLLSRLIAFAASASRGRPRSRAVS